MAKDICFATLSHKAKNKARAKTTPKEPGYSPRLTSLHKHAKKMKTLLIATIFLLIILAFSFHAMRHRPQPIQNPLKTESTEKSEMLVDTVGHPLRDESRKWAVEADTVAKFRKFASGNVLRFEVDQTGDDPWLPQLIAGNLRFEKDRRYTFSFRIRADRPASLTVLVRRNGEPWNELGLHEKINITKDWQTFSFEFTATDTEDTARLDLTMFSHAIYEISDTSLKATPPLAF